jgi:hypothetical protein
MPKRTSRPRRDNRPRVSEAQLQAYRTRKAETVAHPEAQPERAEPNQAQSATPVGVVTAWGNVGDEYEMIRADLIRLLLITAAMFIIILVLWFFLA